MTESTVPLWRRTSGAGPLLVLIHGITEDHRSFDPLLPSLERHYRVLTVDLRGHGASPAADGYGVAEMAADVAAVVAEVTAEEADRRGGDGAAGDGVVDERATVRDEAPLVIGHSLGGMVAAAYGARFPVRGVVNIDQSLDLAGMQAQVKTIEPMLRGDGFGAVISAMFEQLAGALPEVEQRRIAAIRRPVQQVVLGVWAPLLDLSAEDLVTAVDALVTPAAPYPYLQVQGIDPGADYPGWLRQRVPGAKFDLWTGLGHYPHLCQPERFLALVRAFDPAV
jgi:pimeloyl-ACP methyl ester carboxylesterase